MFSLVLEAGRGPYHVPPLQQKYRNVTVFFFRILPHKKNTRKTRKNRYKNKNKHVAKLLVSDPVFVAIDFVCVPERSKGTRGESRRARGADERCALTSYIYLFMCGTRSRYFSLSLSRREQHATTRVGNARCCQSHALSYFTFRIASVHSFNHAHDFGRDEAHGRALGASVAGGEDAPE